MVGGRRWVMDWKGMFSFTREETDLQTGRKKNSTELDEKGRRSVLTVDFSGRGTLLL